MKQSIAILLATMLLAVCLTACGRRDNYGQDDNTTNNQTNDTAQNSANPGNSGEDAVLDSDANGSGEERPHESANNAASNGEIGVSYEQMLRNGHVHDTDGLLKDGENSVSNLMGDAGNAARDLARDAKNGVENLMR